MGTGVFRRPPFRPPRRDVVFGPAAVGDTSLIQAEPRVLPRVIRRDPPAPSQRWIGTTPPTVGSLVFGKRARPVLRVRRLQDPPTQVWVGTVVPSVGSLVFKLQEVNTFRPRWRQPTPTQEWIGTVEGVGNVSLLFLHKRRRFIRPPWVMPRTTHPWIPSFSDDVAYVVVPIEMVFFDHLNRLRFQHQKITGGTLDPAFDVGGHRIGWLSNRLKFRHEKIQ